ncbi:MAG: YqeG family HAD IIIA-type phosphatase [Bacilli bacterium]|nr:YqeG family HAD IIIA-type phosphatase [Bacilli bacterium]
MKRFTPTFYANNLYEIDPKFFVKNHVKVLLLDLDNTLESYRVKTPSKRTIDYIKRLKANGLRPVITSNNTGKRVRTYAKDLEIEFLAFVNKPFKGRLLRKLRALNINPDDCLIIGDQMMTDVQCGNSAHIRTLLTEKLVKEDPIRTKINRLFEKPLRARLKKCGKLNSWKNYL